MGIPARPVGLLRDSRARPRGYVARSVPTAPRSQDKAPPPLQCCCGREVCWGVYGSKATLSRRIGSYTTMGVLNALPTAELITHTSLRSVCGVCTLGAYGTSLAKYTPRQLRVEWCVRSHHTPYIGCVS